MSTLDLTLGALEIGVLMSTVLYGVLTAQAFVFSGRSTEDPLWLRIMVSFSLGGALHPWSSRPLFSLTGWNHLVIREYPHDIIMGLSLFRDSHALRATPVAWSKPVDFGPNQPLHLVCRGHCASQSLCLNADVLRWLN